MKKRKNKINTNKIKIKEEKTLIILKPDALQRNLIGEIIHRFERKGLRIAGLKMIRLEDILLEKHYFHHKDKEFFDDLKCFMKSSPVVCMILAGPRAISIVRLLAGSTKGYEAFPGTIRGDFSISTQSNIIHASDSEKTAQTEIKRFFKPKEIFDYQKEGTYYLCSEFFPQKKS